MEPNEPTNKEKLNVDSHPHEKTSDSEREQTDCKPRRANKRKKQRKLNAIPIDTPPYHTKSKEEVFDKFGVTTDGIASSEEAKRIQQYGRNELRGDSGVRTKFVAFEIQD